MQARRALRLFPYGGGKIEHLILYCHSVKTFALQRYCFFANYAREKEKTAAIYLYVGMTLPAIPSVRIAKPRQFSMTEVQ